MKKIILIALMVLMALGIMAILVQPMKKPDPQVIEVTELYLESVKQQDFETLDKLLYFGPKYEAWRAPIYQSMKSDYLISYEIQQYKKLGKDIYQVTFQYDSKAGSGQVADNYVVRIQGEWKYAANPRNVPQDIYLFDHYDDTVPVTEQTALP